MKTQFTPGPWEYRAFPTENCVVFDISSTEPDMNDVAFTYSHEANARLIAAAPCLLEALQNLINAHAIPSSICKERPAYEAARAVVAKATGGTT